METIKCKGVIMCPTCNAMQEAVEAGRWQAVKDGASHMAVIGFEDGIEAIFIENKNVEGLEQDQQQLPPMINVCDVCLETFEASGFRRWWLIQAIVHPWPHFEGKEPRCITKPVSISIVPIITDCQPGTVKFG